MKKPVIIAILLLLISGLASGQIKFGPKVGYNASTLTTNIDSIKTSFKSGLQFGAFVRIGNRFYLQPELYYSTHGGVFEKDSAGSYWNQNINIGSVDIPVLIGFKLLNTDMVNIRLLAGPAVSFVVNKKITTTGDLTGPIDKADIGNANWYIQAGGGVDVWMFTFDVRYQIGLNKIIQEVNYQGGRNFNTSNNVWVFSLGLKI
jgi:hypothetical protein